jgi:hypothetical protein
VSEIFADRICQLCADDLRMFASLREDLIAKQKDLYQLAGLELDDWNADIKMQSYISVAEENDTVQDETHEFDMNFESIEPEDTAAMYIEEDEEELNSQDGNEMYVEDDGTEDEAIIKIEKVETSDAEEKKLLLQI